MTVTLSGLARFLLITLCGLYAGNGMTSMQHDTATTPAEIRQFFAQQHKTVLTFIGYSGAGYQDPAAMLRIAADVLNEFDPANTIVNTGATQVGIGAVYELAKARGFITTGIVSTQAKKYQAELSHSIDHVFFVEDDTWGGIDEASGRLSPTSTAMVENSHLMIAIGGGSVGRDEILEAKRLKKEVRYFPADMHHQRAIEKATEKGLPAPTDFSGAVSEAFE
jgi:hypothetical protein